MDNDIIQVLIDKTISGKIVWEQTSQDNTLYLRVYPISEFSHVCFLDTGSFLIDYHPVYPVKDSWYELSWYAEKFEVLVKLEKEHIIRTDSTKNYQDADGHNRSNLVKVLYDFIYQRSDAYKRSKVTGVVPDLSKARQALGLT